MFRSIPRFSSVPRSLLVFPIARTFNRNARPNFNPLSLRTQPSPAHLYPRTLLVSKSLFSTTQLRSTSDAEKKAKFEAERQAALMQKLKVDPENVTSTSSVVPIFDHRPTNRPAPSDGPDVFHELKSDLVGPYLFGAYFSSPWISILMGLFLANVQRNLRDERSSEGDALYWIGWVGSVCWDIPINPLPCLGYQLLRGLRDGVSC